MAGAALSLLALTAILAGLTLAGLRARRWLAGAPAEVDWVAGLRDLPRRYLVNVHDVVGRKPENARFHALAAGGFLASFPLLLAAGIPALQGPILWTLILFALASALAGGAMDVGRRRSERPAELSQGSFRLFPFALIGYAGAIFLVALDQLVGGLLPYLLLSILVGVAAAALTWLLLGVLGGPLKHALAGAAHLVAHPRPERFGRMAGPRPATAATPLDLSAPKLGVETPSDFAWNRLLGFDACVECGRCETVCPAYDAGLPLNPKALIQDLVRGMEAGEAGAYAGHAHPGRDPRDGAGPAAPLLPSATSADTLWACTTCRACVEACPMMIEHVDAVLDLRRFETLEKGATPGKGADALAELSAADNPAGLPARRRIDWAVDLALPLIAERDSCDVLLWLGDAAFDLRGQRTLRALVTLLRRGQVDFAALGAAELDCGDLARRLGDEATFQDLARRNIAELSRHRFQRIVTADPHALHVLRNEYPDFGGRYAVLHHSALLLELVEAERLETASLQGVRLTYHDPCYLGRYNGEFDAPRTLLDRAGAERVEMARSGRFSHCCGGGGGAPLTDVPGEARIPDRRMDQARETGAEIVAVACPGCTQMLEGVTGRRPEVRDIAELLAGGAP